MSVRFDLPDGYSLGTHRRGFVYVHDGRAHGPDGFVNGPGDRHYRTPGEAVRAIIEADGVVGSARARLEAQIAALPEALR